MMMNNRIIRWALAVVAIIAVAVPTIIWANTRIETIWGPINGPITSGDCVFWGPGLTDAGGACGGGSGGLAIGTSVITGGTSGAVLYVNGTVLGNFALGTGVQSILSVTPGLTGSFTPQDGTIVAGHCLQWGPGVEDAGAACGTGGGGGGITIGTTVVAGGTNGFFLYVNGTVVGNTASGTGVITAVGLPVNASGGLVTQSGVLSSGAIVTGGGSALPVTSATTAAGVLTSLGIAPGTSGSFAQQAGVITAADCLNWGPGVQDSAAPCGAVTIGAPITGGVSGYALYDNGGLVGNFALGSGVQTALGNGVDTVGGAITAAAIPTLNSILVGGGVAVGINPTTTGSGVVSAIGQGVDTANGIVTQAVTLTANSLLIGGGASTGISPTTTAAGTLTALGIAAGTTGSFTTQDGAVTTGDCLKWGPGIQDATAACIINGGPLGTPSSGTLTNATGLNANTGLTGTTLASSVVTSSLTTVGTIGTGTWAGTTIATAHGGTGNTTIGTGVQTALTANTNSLSGGIILNGGAPLQVAVRSVGTTTVAIAATDYFLCLDPTSNAITANLPASPATGLTFLIKDCTGQSATHNITVTPSSGNIDGSATFVINTAYVARAFTYTGSQWSAN